MRLIECSGSFHDLLACSGQKPNAAAVINDLPAYPRRMIGRDE